MKVLVIPDVHLKPHIFDQAERLMILNKYDAAVFVGDLVDDWDKGNNLNLYKETFDRFGAFLKKYPNTFICYGNHDLSYFWNEWETGYSAMARETVVSGFHYLYQKHSINKFKIIHRIDNVLFSHAGVSTEFLDFLSASDLHSSADNVIEKINNFGQRELWTNVSPIWLRPDDYTTEKWTGFCTNKDEETFFLQVVGHTPVVKPKFYEKNDILITDTFSTYSNGSPIGNQKFVWIDTITKEWGEI